VFDTAEQDGENILLYFFSSLWVECCGILFSLSCSVCGTRLQVEMREEGGLSKRLEGKLLKSRLTLNTSYFLLSFMRLAQTKHELSTTEIC
jgi:hypothetical protein